MTTTGLSLYQPSAATITSVGKGQHDGWVSVATMKGADIGSGKRAFAVSLTVSNISAPFTSPQALIMVALGNDKGVLDWRCVQALPFDGKLLFRRKAVGFYAAQVWAGAGSSHAAWSSSDDFIVWARVAQNGGTQAAGGFEIADIAIHCYDLDVLTDHMFGGGESIGPAINYGGFGTSVHFKNLLSSTNAALKADKTWLVHHGHHSFPDGNNAGLQVLEFQYMPDSASGGTAKDLYRPAGSVTHSFSRHAYSYWGYTNAKGTKTLAVQWQSGGWFQLTTAASDPNPAFRVFGIANTNIAQDYKAWWDRSEWFAINVDQMEEYSFQEITPDVDMYNGGGVLLADVTYEPHEFTRTQMSDVEFMWAADSQRSIVNGYNLPNPLEAPFHASVVLDSAKQRVLIQHGAQHRNLEMHSVVHCTPLGLLRQDAVRARLFGWGIDTGKVKSIKSGIIRSLQWRWVDSNADPYPVPFPGPTVYLTPTYEGLGLGSLTEISPAPEGAYDERTFDPKERIETDMGYQPTWPLFTTGRKRMQLRWSGLTRAERDTLDAFLVIQTNQVFKWNRPHYGELALVPIGPLRTQPQGVTHAATLDVLQLVWIGP